MYLNYGNVEQFIQAGLDPKTCRGSMKIGPDPTLDRMTATPLIAVAAHCMSGSLQSLFNAGVDLNATDERGQTALDYALQANAHDSTMACNETVNLLRGAHAAEGGNRVPQGSCPKRPQPQRVLLTRVRPLKMRRV